MERVPLGSESEPAGTHECVCSLYGGEHCKFFFAISPACLSFVEFILSGLSATLPTSPHDRQVPVDDGKTR